MQLIPTTTVGSYHIYCTHPQSYYLAEQDLTLVYCQDTKQYYLLRQDATLLDNNLINGDPLMVYPMSCCGLLLVTIDHVILSYKILVNDSLIDEDYKPAAKKPKLEKHVTGQYQKLFQAKDGLDWVQHVDPTTLYALSVASNCIYIYDFNSAQYETIPLPHQLYHSLSTSRPTCFIKINLGSEEIPYLDPVFEDHFGINSPDGIFMGFENGCIFYVPRHITSTDTVLLSQIQFESIIGIHTCHTTTTTDDDDDSVKTENGKDLLIFVGSKGTIQLYSKSTMDESRQAIYYKEFSLPSSVTAISFAKDSASALAFCSNSMLYLVEFSQSMNERQHKTTDLVLRLTQLQSPDDICFIHYIKKYQQNITYQIITSTGHVTTCKADLGSSPVNITRTSDSLKKAINDTLAELSELETYQTNMNSYHEDVNRQLISLNRTLHTLQNASLRKKKNGSTDFNLEITPLVKQVPITGELQPYLRIRIQTKLLLNWTDWYLNLDIEHQRTTKQESDSYALDITDFEVGKTISLPLNGFNSEDDATGAMQTWERDLELDLRYCPLPLDINVCISMNTDTNEMIDRNTPILEYLPISSTSSNCRINFPVTSMTVDYLHFAMPLSTFQKQQLKNNGIRDLTKRMQHRWNYLTTNNAFDVDTKLLHDNLTYDTSNIQLRFVAPTNIDELYRSILPALLSEGKPSEEISQLLNDAEHASLSLAIHPMYPATITLSKTPEKPDGDLFVDLQLRCLSTLVLIKIESSLLSRIQPYTKGDDDVDDDDGNGENDHDSTLNKFESASFYKIHQQLEGHLDSLEKHYQRRFIQKGTEGENLWQDLRAAWELSRQLHHEQYISIYEFSI